MTRRSDGGATAMRVRRAVGLTCLAVAAAAVIGGCSSGRRRRRRRPSPGKGGAASTRGGKAKEAPGVSGASDPKPAPVPVPATAPTTAGLEFAEIEPDPVEWEREPHARTSAEVVMKARALELGGAVEYRFECTSGGGHSSEWRAEPGYTDKSLAPRTEYTYVARARDKATGTELAPPSRPVKVATRAAKHGRGVDSTHVAAIDKAIAEGTLEVTPIMLSGDKDNRINIIVIGRWQKGQRDAYNDPARRDEFLEDARYVLKAFTAGDERAMSPYPNYRDFFNVYAVWWPDIPPWDPKDRKGGMHWADYNEIRARLFLPWQIEGRGWVTHLAMFNGSGGGGGAGLREGPRVGDAMIVGNQVNGFIHEFNHTAPGIPDEYTSSGLWGSGGEGSTTTNEYRPGEVNWRKWIEPGTPVPTPYARKYADKVGTFEGGVHRMAHLYRPTARGCIMGAGSFAGNSKVMCLVCRQRAVMRFYRWVSAFDRRTPARSEIALAGPGKVRFAVERVHPEPDTQKVEWRLNGKVIARDTDEVEVGFDALAEYELVCSLVDECEFIRPDPPYAELPRAEVRWKITNAKPSSKAEPLRVTLAAKGCAFAGVDDGAIEAKVAGGKPPYSYIWSDGVSTKGREGLASGSYRLAVVDAEFRSCEVEATLARVPGLTPTVRSERRGGKWGLRVHPADMAGVTCEWSTGTRGMRVSGLANGTYRYTLRHAGGSEARGSVRLTAPARPFGVKIAEVRPSSGGWNNGMVRIDARGGRAPYAFAWPGGVNTVEPERHFLAPGEYRVTATDANMTAVELDVTVGHAKAFVLERPRFERASRGSVRIADPKRALRYLWFAEDRPAHLPRYPHGIYTGSFTAPGGAVSEAVAYVIQNKGGLFVDDRRAKNNLGHWVYLRGFTAGRGAEPMRLKLRATRGGKNGDGLSFEQGTEDAIWRATLKDGRLTVSGTGKGDGDDKGRFELLYASHPERPDEPLHVGATFAPPRGGNYFVAAQDAASGAMSTNRVGVAVTMGSGAPKARPLAPDKVRGAKLLMWLDASDTDGDGVEDAPPPRRGAVMGWKGKAGGVGSWDFVYYLPNAQNGRGVASWKTIWIQNLGKPVKGFRTIFMVRREHDYSSVGTAPWRDLKGLIGVGEFGERLMSDEAAREAAKGAVRVDGSAVDPATARMPKGFYVATYEFARKIDRAFRTTDGHWEGAIAECLVYDGKLGPEERGRVEAYLFRKWISEVHLEAGR